MVGGLGEKAAVFLRLNEPYAGFLIGAGQSRSSPPQDERQGVVDNLSS